MCVPMLVTTHVETVVKLVRKAPDAYIDITVDMDEMMTFYFVYPNPSIFVPDTEKCPSSWLIHLRYGTKNSLKNKEKRLDYIGRIFL